MLETNGPPFRMGEGKAALPPFALAAEASFGAQAAKGATRRQITVLADLEVRTARLKDGKALPDLISNSCSC
jgi:hypothetical protein